MTKDNITNGAVPIEPEVPVWKPGQKRLFPEDFKRRAVAYYESLPEDGSRGGYLRRSGIRSSSMSEWRRAVKSDTATKIGRKPTDLVVRENAQLKTRIAQLEDELKRANTVIEVQKKVSALLENISGPTS